MEFIQRGGLKIVFGLGQTGWSVVEFCYLQKIPCRLVDTRTKPNSWPQNLNVPESVLTDMVQQGLYAEMLTQCHTNEKEATEYFCNVSEMVLSPGISPQHPFVIAAQKYGVSIVNDITLFVRWIRQYSPSTKLLGITGSNGKSTLVSGLAGMGQYLNKKTRAIGNIGVPVLSIIPEPPKSASSEKQPFDLEIAVLELSSFQLEVNNNLGLDIALVANITEDHLDRHETMQAYWLAKQKIFQEVSAVIINKDDPLSTPLTARSVEQCVRYGVSTPDKNDFGIIVRQDTAWIAQGVTLLMPVDQLFLQHRHNISNALALLAFAHLLNWPMKSACEYLKTFKGLPHRFEAVHTQDGINWINDSKATNVGASLAAIQSLDAQRFWWIGGGVSKDADFSELCMALNEKQQANKLLGCLLFGQDGSKIEQALRLNMEKETIQINELTSHVASNKTVIALFNTLEEVIHYVKVNAKPQEVILFSPACASLDQYQNFEARGEHFKELCSSVQANI